MNLLALGEILRSHRVVAGLSQEDLALRSGVSARTISDLERGQRTRTHLETARLLADALSLENGDRRRFLEASAGGSRAQNRVSDRASTLPLDPHGGSNLPSPRTSLIGRDRLVSDVITVLKDHIGRIVTLTGPGGVGKTRLAIEVAGKVDDAFADGVWFVPLAPVNHPSLVPDAIARTLGVRASGDQPLLDRISAHVASRETLLILDNFEHLIDAAPVVTPLLSASPGLRVLATSRVALNVTGEQRFPVPPLALPAMSRVRTAAEIADVAAVRLFCSRAQAAQPTFALTDRNAPAVADICARLDGLPLAIELAAARSPVLAPEALLARLSPTLGLLMGGPRDHPDRLQTMRAAVAWSYNLLSPAEQEVFRRLAVFVGGCTLEAAEAVAGTGALDGIATLVASSLLDQRVQPDGQPRYYMLEMVREFGIDQLEAAGEASESRQRHADYFAALGEQGYPNQVGAFTGIADRFRQLETEQANVRAAFTALAGAGDGEGVLRLAAALSVFWQHRAHLREASQWLEWGLAHTPETPTVIRGQGLRSLAMIRTSQGNHAEAEHLANAAFVIAEHLGDPKLSALVSHALGVVAFNQQRWNEAALHLEVAFEKWRALGALAEEAMCLQMLSGVAYCLGDRAVSAERAKASLEKFRAIGHTSGAAMSLCWLARLARDRHDHRGAALAYHEALQLWVSIRDRWYITGALAGLAELASARGHVSAAATLLGGIDALVEEAGAGPHSSGRDSYQRAGISARVALGDAQFTELYAAGRELPWEAIVTTASSLPTPTGSTTTFLTHREREVLLLIAGGQTDREIAETLFVSYRTVNSHVASILAKLEAPDRRAAVSVARGRGWLTPVD